jgi:hypothetical protein
VALVGTTGSGKTELARFLLSHGGERIVVLDPKHEFDLEDFKVKRKLPVFDDKWKIIYRPGADDDTHMAKLITQCHKRGNCRIYDDEAATLNEFFPKTTKVLDNLARTGRSANVSLWSTTQRPRWVSRAFFTESEVWFIFTLRDPNDRKHVAGFIGPEAGDKLPMYDFLYLRPGMDNPTQLHLDLESQTLQEASPNGKEG